MRAAVAALSEASAGRPITQVWLDVDAGVDLAAADAAWRLAAATTCAEDAKVTWRRAADLLRCFDCGREFEGRAADRCPQCGGPGLVIVPAPEVAVVRWC